MARRVDIHAPINFFLRFRKNKCLLTAPMAKLYWDKIMSQKLFSRNQRMMEILDNTFVGINLTEYVKFAENMRRKSVLKNRFSIIKTKFYLF